MSSDTEQEQQGLPCPVCGQYFSYLQQHLERKSDEEHRQYRNGGQVPDQSGEGAAPDPQKPEQDQSGQDPQQMFEGDGQNTSQQVQQQQKPQQNNNQSQGQGGQQEKFVTGSSQPQQARQQQGQQVQQQPGYNCMECGARVTPGQTSCRECGEEFNCQECGAPLPVGTPKCRCGYGPLAWDQIMG